MKGGGANVLQKDGLGEKEFPKREGGGKASKLKGIPNET